MLIVSTTIRLVSNTKWCLWLQVIEMCHEKGVLVVADEIMCGLGRHGQMCPGVEVPPMFLSQAWHLPVDAVTFGKAICAGAYPMSGVVCRHGAKQVCNCNVVE